MNNFGIANTDLNWFSQLRNEGYSQSPINFWTPTPWNIKKLQKGDFLYFMLKSPIRKIGGYGRFVEYKKSKVPENIKLGPNVNIFKERIKSWVPDNCECNLCQD